MGSWITRNTEAVAAMISALATVIAILAIGYQLNRADEAQALQAARAAYDNHLNQSLQYPHLAAPGNACALLSPAISPSYATFMEQLTYAAEQMLSVSEGWEASFAERMAPHMRYICTIGPNMADTPKTRALLNTLIKNNCAKLPPCHTP